jgi:diguanylate cyclase (GGDEF)-like protein
MRRCDTKTRKERILVIGEDKKTADTLKRCLGESYFIDSCPSFSRSVSMVSKRPYNVLIAGMKMPGEKGIEVLHKLKEIKSEIPVIVITTHDSVPLAVKAMKAGAYDYITSPFNVAELKIIVSHASEWCKMVEEVKEKRIFQELALTDPLTKLYNRRYFEELLRREAERSLRYRHEFSVLFIDIDDFKKCNDTYGHKAGDEILCLVSNSIIHQTRSTDIVARYGGEEFVVLAPDTDKKHISLLAARLVRFIANKNMVVDGSVRVKVSVSVGISCFGEDTTDQKKLLDLADRALYEAKRLGKNRVCMFGISTMRKKRSRNK